MVGLWSALKAAQLLFRAVLDYTSRHKMFGGFFPWGLVDQMFKHLSNSCN